jgi:predicted enzyme related to lactoylglutathione lyase
MSEHHGRFIWYELITTDLDGASRFYEDVVGWTHEDMTNDCMTYRMVKADGNGVGGMLLIPPEAKAMNAPPSWAGYIAVDDCDAAADKIKRLGGQVIRAPDDIPEVGRFAVVADPQGAVFEIMKPFPPPGARPEFPARGVPGHCSWRELYAGDLETAFAFYAEMFGWRKDEAVPMGPMGTYQLYANQDGVVGGMMTKPPQVPRPCFVYYFQVGDIDAAAERVKKGGGQVYMGPMEVPGGDWVLQGADPQGAVFALVGTKG